MDLRFRQVHLDFHTSELIPGVGEDFDPEEFAQILSEACVDSVTCFSRCHHGMIYHDTRFPAHHPSLKRNLLAEQIEACHSRGIRVPIYITVGFDEYMAKRHPEWVETTPEGTPRFAGPLQAGWKKLCLNAQPYIDYVIEQTHEVLETMPVDGLFFDIILQWPCVCHSCLEGMQKEGLDPGNPAHRELYAIQVLNRFRRRMTVAVREVNKDCSLFFNSGHVGPSFRPALDTFTHLEIESLPSGGWGYTHFPVTVRFARNLGLPTLGMTGRFHKSWGDFGGMKNPAALEYECFSALAEGSGCSVGDQLHPRGKIDKATYDLIGGVFKKVKEKEPWCVKAHPVTEIAVFTPEALGVQDGQIDSALAGVTLMLAEGHHQFDVVDQASDWTAYRVMVLPDKITLDTDLVNKVSDYLKSGGRLILSHRSGTGSDAPTTFVLPEMPCVLRGEGSFSPDFILAGQSLSEGIPQTPHVMYERSLEVAPVSGAEVLAEIGWPYFNREWKHFCSHAQTPCERPSGMPAVIQRDQIIYFAHPLFGMYKRHGAKVYKDLFLNALRLLLPNPLIKATAPSTARVTLLEQPKENRHIVHVLHYIPENRCGDVPVIEDVIPLHEVRIGVHLPAPKHVYLAPERKALPFETGEGYVWVTLPRVDGHAMLVLEG